MRERYERAREQLKRKKGWQQYAVENKYACARSHVRRLGWGGKDRERREEWQRESWCAEKCVGRVWRGDNSGEVRVPHVEVRVVRVLQYDCGSGRVQIHV